MLGNLFRRKPAKASPDFRNPVTTELHSHLIPGIDDGCPTLDASLNVLRSLQQLGYRKVITTPHIMGDFYKNGRHNIPSGADQIREVLDKEGIELQFEAAAEYLADEVFEEKIRQKDLLSFGDQYVLFELPFTTEPLNLPNIIFELQMSGYQPVLAHPERYSYMAFMPESYEELRDKGVYLQLNIMSLSGHYGPDVRKTAEMLIDKKWVDFVGSDCHGPRHIPVLNDSLHTAYYQKACNLRLRNNQL